ncbi:hypothetical protein JMA_08850 [Jeotgalibacillus malaysiensis]|uniref:Uncharacterized protein n=1 Tax=Jeotgalibacillus malaysiensis TaxID=1508404 RepID=A0A0B5ANG3_9BACL|nr:hypothetical protein [Jeotgalibacillus malaysiensis]AJD90202.1 hypothetical protein JMA_08850 [Jeotgalibacillus malaysiensis]
MMKAMFLSGPVSLGILMLIGQPFWGLISAMTFLFAGAYFSKPRFNQE